MISHHYIHLITHIDAFALDNACLSKHVPYSLKFKLWSIADEDRERLLDLYITYTGISESTSPTKLKKLLLELQVFIERRCDYLEDLVMGMQGYVKFRDKKTGYLRWESLIQGENHESTL